MPDRNVNISYRVCNRVSAADVVDERTLAARSRCSVGYGVQCCHGYYMERKEQKKKGRKQGRNKGSKVVKMGKRRIKTQEIKKKGNLEGNEGGYMPGH